MEENNLYVPLNFWFNSNPGLALPVVALNTHEIKVSIKFWWELRLYKNFTFSHNNVNYDDVTLFDIILMINDQSRI